jgi:leucyl-tRNA synthetase
MIKMLNPITPHICESLWQALGEKESLQTAAWPKVDKAALVEDEKLIIVQVNGKVRAKLTVAADIGKNEIEQLAQEHDNVQQFISEKTIRKVIYVPGKLVNIVAN